MISLGKRPREGFSSSTPGALGYTPGHAKGPRGLPYGSNIPVQNISSQIHTQTNTTASVPLLVRPWRDNNKLIFFPGNILFVEKSAKGMLNNVLGVAGLNENKVDVSNYNFLGVYRNETNVVQHLERSRKQQLLINVDVFGRSRIANIFGNVSQGDHVGLALGTTEDNGQLKRILLPTVNGKVPKEVKHSILANPLYFGIDGDNKKMSIPIPIGVVSFTSKKVSGKKISDALLDSDKMAQLPQIEILML
tara:strand:+ start:386 stop:1132 length:747 start_codon:yes stop_codon:yes gene_type:complete